MLKAKLSYAPILALSNFNQVFEVEIDACSKGIGAILVQKGRLVGYFYEKLSGARQKWVTYE